MSRTNGRLIGLVLILILGGAAAFYFLRGKDPLPGAFLHPPIPPLIVNEPPVAKTGPIVVLSTQSPGMPSIAMERTIVMLLERLLMGLYGIVSMRSQIYDGHGRIEITFATDRDQNLETARVLNLLNGQKDLLLAQIQTPRLDTRSPDTLPILWLEARSDVHDFYSISRFVNEEVRKSLFTIPGLQGMELRGESRRQVVLHLDPNKLQARNLSVTQVVEALEQGKINLDPPSIDELHDLTIDMKNGVPILLRDIGIVNDESRRLDYALHDGRRTLLVGIHLSNGAKPEEVVAAVRAALPKINAQAPDNLSVHVVADATDQRTKHLLVEARFPEAMRREESEVIAQRLVTLLREETGITSSLTLGPIDSEHGNIFRILLPVPVDAHISVEKINQRLRQDPGVQNLQVRILDLAGQRLPQRVEFPVQIRLVGKDREILGRWADAIVKKTKETPNGVRDLVVEGNTRQSSLRIVLDRAKAASLGLTARDVMMALGNFHGSAVMPDLMPRLDAGFVDIGLADSAMSRVALRGGTILIDMGAERPTRPEDIGLIPLSGAKNRNAQVFVRDVAKIEQEQTPTSLERFNGKPFLVLTANHEPGTPLPDAKAHLRKIAEEARTKLKLPPQFEIVGD